MTREQGKGDKLQESWLAFAEYDRIAWMDTLLDSTVGLLMPFPCRSLSYMMLPQVQYILCIRPNMENNPLVFEEEYVTQQLLSASIVEAAQVTEITSAHVYGSEG